MPDFERKSSSSSSLEYRTVHRKKSTVSWSNDGNTCRSIAPSVVLHQAAGADRIHRSASASVVRAGCGWLKSETLARYGTSTSSHALLYTSVRPPHAL